MNTAEAAVLPGTGRTAGSSLPNNRPEVQEFRDVGITDHQRQIRKVRDEHAKECGYDVHRAFEQLRAETEQLKKQGWRVVDRSAARSVVREEPGAAGA
jgi:hypothetical protein